MSGPASLAPIVRALGGDLWAGGRRANVPGPGHGPLDRSVSLLLSHGRVVVHCFAGDDWRGVLADLVRRGLVEPDGRLVGAAGGTGPTAPQSGRRERLAAAQRLWAEGRPLGRSVSGRHLALRGVHPPAEGLRHHPGVPAAVYAEAGPRRPALLAAIRAPESGEVVGVEVTYLAPNGLRAPVRLPRKTIGLCPPGAAVRLAPVGPRLLVGEGVFTCLSAAARFGLPPWALLSTRNLRCWRPPPDVRFVLIAADRGADGEASARILAAGLRARGVDRALRWPPAPFADWNEAVGAGPGAGEGKEGRDRMGVADGRSGPPARRPEAMTPDAEDAADAPRGDASVDDGLTLIPDALRPILVANAGRDGDHAPVLKLFNPAGPGTWLITEIGDDGDTMFGLCDLDMGFPELGSVSLSEITSVKLPLGLTIERDVSFRGRVPISRWMRIARQTGSIRAAEAVVRDLPAINGTAAG